MNDRSLGRYRVTQHGQQHMTISTQRIYDIMQQHADKPETYQILDQYLIQQKRYLLAKIAGINSTCDNAYVALVGYDYDLYNISYEIKLLKRQLQYNNHVILRKRLLTYERQVRKIQQRIIATRLYISRYCQIA